MLCYVILWIELIIVFVVLCCVLLNCAPVLWCSVRSSAVLRDPVMRCIVLSRAFRVVLCCVVLCCPILSIIVVVLYCVVLC